MSLAAPDASSSSSAVAAASTLLNGPPPSPTPPPRAVIPEASREFDAFLSHNWAHKPVVEAFVTLLKERGVRVWVDHERMTGYMKDTIDAALANSRVVIAFLSRHYPASKICRDELRIASLDPHTRIVPVRLEAPPFADVTSREEARARREALDAEIQHGDAPDAVLASKRAEVEALDEALAYADHYDEILPILKRPGDDAWLYVDRAESADWAEYARLWTAPGGYGGMGQTAEALQHGALQEARARIDWEGRLLDVAFPAISAAGEERFDVFVAEKHKLCLPGAQVRASSFTPLASPLSPAAVSMALADFNAGLGVMPSFVDADKSFGALKMLPLPLSLCRFRARMAASASGSAGGGSAVPSAWGDGVGEGDVEAYGAGSAAIKELANSADRSFHVVAGVAGAGKTCLLRVIARCHGSARKGAPELYMDIEGGDFGDFRRIILLRLRDIESRFGTDKWVRVKDALRRSASPRDAAAFCVACAYDLANDAANTRALADALFDDASDEARRTLWLLDGFDELGADERARAAALARLATSASAAQVVVRGIARMSSVELVHVVMELLVSQRHVLVTTRPAFAASLGQRAYIRIDPLDFGAVADFCARALAVSPGEVATVFEPTLLEAMRTPVIMHMAIVAQMNRGKSSASFGGGAPAGAGELTLSTAGAAPTVWAHPVTDLYSRIVGNMRARFKGSAAEWDSVLDNLRRLSLRGCARGEYAKLDWDGAGAAAPAYMAPDAGTAAVTAILPASSSTAIIGGGDKQALFSLVEAAGVVDVFNDRTVEFAHRSLQEFFAAQAIAAALASDRSMTSDELTALKASSNDALRRFVISTLNSLSHANYLVELIWETSSAGAAAPSFSEDSLSQLAHCICFAPPYLASSLACASAVRAKADACWSNLKDSDVGNSFWVIVDTLTGGAAASHRALEILETYARDYRLARWNKAVGTYTHNFPETSTPIAAVRVILAVTFETLRGKQKCCGALTTAAPVFRELSAEPTWAPKEDARTCRSCSKAFSFFRWRHHCRRCGLVYCAYCAPIRFIPAMLPAVRLCSDCSSECSDSTNSVDTSSVLPFGLPRTVAALRAVACARIGRVRAPAIVALAVFGGALGGEKDCLLAMARSTTEDIQVRRIALAELGARHATDSDVRSALSALMSLPTSEHNPDQLVFAIVASFEAADLPDDVIEAILVHPTLGIEVISQAISPRPIDCFLRRLHLAAPRAFDMLTSIQILQPSVFEKVCYSLLTQPPPLSLLDKVTSHLLSFGNQSSRNPSSVNLASIGMCAGKLIKAMFHGDDPTGRDPSRKVLILNSEHIGPACANALAAALPYVSSLTQLDLSQNSIVAAGAASLAVALPAMKTLTVLNVDGNELGDSGIISLSQAIPSLPALAHLHLSDNEISTIGTTAFAASLPFATALARLDLSRNKIGATALARVLPSMMALVQLDLSRNNLKPLDIVALAKAFPSMKSLAQLNLSHNDISDNGAVGLAAALPFSKALTQLKLFNTSISDTGATALAAALPSMAALEHLDLDKNDIGAKGATALAEVLPMTALSHLCFSVKGIGAGASALSVAVRAMTELRQLELSCDSSRDVGLKAIRNAAREKCAVKWVREQSDIRLVLFQDYESY